MNSENMKQAERSTSDLILRIQSKFIGWEAEGKDAWTALKKLRGNNLTDGDEIIIARNLYKEVESLKEQLKRQGIGIGQFAIEAGLGNEGDYSKELYRMTLAAGKDPAKVRLRKSAAKYRNLISAISKYTRESTSNLAHRMLSGTSLNPKLKEMDEIENLQLVLQTIVNQVDKEFGLFATYMATAEAKVAQAKSGSRMRWPQYDQQMRASDFMEENDFFHEKNGEESLSEDEAMYQRELKDAYGTSHAFWVKDSSFSRSQYYWWPMADGSGCIQDDEYFYVPHVHLGMIEMFNLPDPTVNPAEFDESLNQLVAQARKGFKEVGEVPEDDWDEINFKPVGQTTSLGASSNYHAWLVIYPTPDNQRLMPMLYIPFEESGPYLLPLDVASLRILQNAYWISSTEVMPLLDRITQIIGLAPGDQEILLEGFRRTAPWLRHNPILKQVDISKSNRQLLMDYYSRLVQADKHEKGK